MAELETALEQTTQLLNAAEQTADEYREKFVFMWCKFLSFDFDILHMFAKDENERKMHFLG